MKDQLFQQFSQAVSQDLANRNAARAAVEDLLAAVEVLDPPNKHAAWYRRQYEKVARSLSHALKRIDELEAELKALKVGEE